jgi:hypothetical protein
LTIEYECIPCTQARDGWIQDVENILAAFPLGNMLCWIRHWIGSIMEDIAVTPAAITDEQTSACECCGRPVHEDEGVLASDSRELAHYGDRWAEGHESRFTIGIRALDEQGESLAGLRPR